MIDAGYRVHLAHCSAIKKYEGLKYSSDIADAAYLAHVLRLGLLPEGYILPREQRAARDLARKRMQLVRCQTAQILAIESIMARQTGGRMKCAAIKQLTTEQVSALGFESDVSSHRIQPRREPGPAAANLDAGETLTRVRQIAPGLPSTQDRAGYRRHPGHGHHARDRLGEPLCPGRQLQLPAALPRYGKATARRKAKAMATNISPGRLSRALTFACAIVRRREPSMNARSTRAIAL